jgi:hypothetical protein
MMTGEKEARACMVQKGGLCALERRDDMPRSIIS